MNKIKRSSLSEAVKHLNQASDIVSDVLSEEEESLDNMPENLQSSERYENMESAIEHMREAADMISSAVDELEEAQM